MMVSPPLNLQGMKLPSMSRTLVLLGLLGWLLPLSACAGPTAERGPSPEATEAHADTTTESASEKPAAKAKASKARAAKAKRDEMAEVLAIIGSPKELAARADEASAKLRSMAKKDPKNVLAHYNLGLIAWSKGDRQSAAASWKQALSINAKYLPARARLAHLKLIQGDKDGAVKDLKRIIDKEAGGDPYQAEARNILAEIAISERRWEDARRHARNVLLGDADNMNAYLNLALTYFRHRLVDTALLIADTALKRRPDAAALHNLMGLIYLKKDNSRLAMNSFSKALAANPSLVDAKLNLAALELSYGDFQSALDRFDSVLGLLPNDPEIVMSRAVALRGLERYDEAADGYKKALALDSGYVQAQYNLCVLHHQYTSKWNEALANCQAYAATLPKRGKKRRELNRRIRSIKSTIEALGPDEGEEAEEPEVGVDEAEGESEGAEATGEVEETTPVEAPPTAEDQENAEAAPPAPTPESP